jgi:hypothetical protein
MNPKLALLVEFEVMTGPQSKINTDHLLRMGIDNYLGFIDKTLLFT